ncbi:MAG: dihydroneopterin aldolase [Caulobacteraceae bacterium]|nr:dihydroneopterin aldolase [Caulobacteraceae bacterium]
MSATVPFPQAAPAVAIESLKVFVRAARIEAEIGVYDHEHGRRQPLIIDVELDLAPRPIEHIADTVNYESVVARAQRLADSGHFKLVEAFAERLARACLEEALVLRVRVRVEKPEALAPTAEAAGVELVMART